MKWIEFYAMVKSVSFVTGIIVACSGLLVAGIVLIIEYIKSKKNEK